MDPQKSVDAWGSVDPRLGTTALMLLTTKVEFWHGSLIQTVLVFRGSELRGGCVVFQNYQAKHTKFFHQVLRPKTDCWTSLQMR